MDNTAVINSLTTRASRITACVHTHPDGDAIGSGLALVSYMTECRGADIVLIVPDRIPDSLAFMLKGFPGNSIMVFDEDPDAAAERIGCSDLIFCLDCSSFSRTDPRMETLLKASTASKVLIDHHLNPDMASFDAVFSETEVSSTCELLHSILKEMPDICGDSGRLPSRCRDSLLTGMTTDTNNFSNSVTPGTLTMASELIAAGVDRDRILQDLYNNFRENRLRLMGYMLLNKLEITPEGVAFMILGEEDQKRFDFRQGEAEGFVNLPLAIANVKMSIMLTQEEDRFRVSIRSKDGVSANACAMKHFSGGGHEKAAGGRLLFPEDIASPEDARAYILKVTKEFFDNR